MEHFRNLVDSGGLQELINTAYAANRALEANGESNPGGWAVAGSNVGQLAFYAQDEWNVTDNFKLTYGVRFDKPLFFDSSQKAQDVIDNAGTKVLSGGRVGLSKNRIKGYVTFKGVIDKFEKDKNK